ncbi:MAG: hypothetical protein CMQ14_07140 [Gammaproteobacteria bacterium]|nr:hypothetical protein [Gammaproteobacteria bacterium]
MPRKKYKTFRPGKPIDGEKVIRIVKEVLEQRQSKELEIAEKRETTGEKDMHKTGWGLPPKLPGSANVTVTPLNIGDIPQAPSDLDEDKPQKPGHK